MSNGSVDARLAGVQPKTVKAGLSTREPRLDRVKEAGALVKTALVRAGIQQKAAAGLMGLSDAQSSQRSWPGRKASTCRGIACKPYRMRFSSSC